jgi:hypothetical protein
VAFAPRHRNSHQPPVSVRRSAAADGGDLSQ